MEIKVKKLHKDAIIPTYGTSGAAAFDLYSIEDVSRLGMVAVRTGLGFEIPEGYGMFIKPRSGMAFKSMTEAFQGTIDSDYRGEVQVLLSSMSMNPIAVKQGDRIAQAVILPVPKVSFTEVQELGETVRGSDGFGSTGA